jgi:hypothetical protein
MKIDIENLERIAAKCGLIQGKWGDGETSVCIMGALAGLDSNECVSNGWPLWLVELFEWFNDSAEPANLVPEMLALGHAAVAFNNRNGDPERLFRDFRLQSVLPIAMKAIGEGDEPWRVGFRDVVRWSLDNDGQVAQAGTAAAARAAARQTMLDCLIRLMKGE